MAPKRASLDDARRLYAQLMVAASNSDDPRLERIFELVPREAFLPPGPWQILVNRRFVETPSADPIHLYQNALVALDRAKGINTGEPHLHAAWLGAVAPQSGETISHIGAGAGYYTAMLSLLTLPGGKVVAFEIDEDLARTAQRNLEPFDSVTVTQGDATQLPLPPSDVIYVNAGVVSPPASWLQALKPGGRLIFPWRPTESVGLSLLVTRSANGMLAKPLMNSWFIPCIGASNPAACTKLPSPTEARSVRSLWLHSERTPDQSAIAICRDVWFSTEPIPADPDDPALH